MEFQRNRFVGAIVWRRDPEEYSYINDIPVVQYLRKNERIVLNSPMTILVGENGTGKSTLLEAIAIEAGLNPEGGTKDIYFSTRDSHSALCDCIALAKYAYPKDGFFLRAESFYNVATKFERTCQFGRFSGSFHMQSHGESFLSAVYKFYGNGLYILDEPEAALSPMRLMDLIVRMDQLIKRNSQFIISTHSPMLMAFPGAEVLELNSEGIRSVGYKETEHYQTMLRFLQNPEKMLRYLLDTVDD